MGFLEDLGRSNALSGVDQLLGKAIDIRRGEDQSADRAMGRAIDLEQLGIAKEASKREATKFSWQEKEQANKRKIAEMPVPITSLFGSNWKNDPAKVIQFNKMKEKGLVEEVAPGILMTTNENAQALKDYGKQDLEWTKSVNEANMVSINNRITQIGEEIAEEKNPEKVEKLTLEQKQLEKKLSGYVAAHKRLDFEQMNKVELEKEKQSAFKSAKVAADPNSSTGFSYFSADGTVLLRGAPKPASVVSEERNKITDRHNRVWEEIKKKGGVGSGGGPTALMKNVEYLTSLGWDRKEAAKLFSSSKPMSRDTFIGQTVSKIMSNDMIDADDKPEQVTRAIEIYDKVIAKTGSPPPNTKVLTEDVVSSLLKEVGNDPAKARALAEQRGYKVK